MNDFDIIKLNSKIADVLIVMKTSDAPFTYLQDIQEQLSRMKASGKVLIDALLHSGNTEERFISGYFNSEAFDNSSFVFEEIDRRDEVRSYICEYLKSDNELLKDSCLTQRQQKLILNGCFI